MLTVGNILSLTAMAAGAGIWLHAPPAALWAGGLLLLALLLFSVAIDRERAPTLGAHSAERRKRVLIVGSGAVARVLAGNLQRDGRYLVVGLVDDVDESHCGAWPILGCREETASLVERHQIDELCLAYAPTWQQQLVDRLSRSTRDVRVRVVPSPYEALIQPGNLESFGDIALVQVSHHSSRAGEIAKRTFDLLAAGVGLLLLFPAMLVIALLIKLTMPGRAIFAQQRVGRYGRPFVLYKFRTMVENAEAVTGPVLSDGLKDARLTPLGRWLRRCRADEIPQLWNVLRGEMSMVGPRPERPCFVQRFTETFPSYAQRHSVRPGITGLAQVYGGYHTDARDKLRFDLIYASRQSLWLDFRILLKTVQVCLFPARH